MAEPVPTERLKKLMELSEDLFAIASLDGHFVNLNPAWESTLGYSLEYLTRTPFLELVHPDDREATVGELDTLAEGNRTHQFANRFRHADGRWVWLRWNAVPDPEEALVYAVARDVTEFHEAQLAVQDYLAALRGSSAMVQVALTHAETLIQQLREQHGQIVALIEDSRSAAA